jgi:hypothetical protein
VRDGVHVVVFAGCAAVVAEGEGTWAARNIGDNKTSTIKALEVTQTRSFI